LPPVPGAYATFARDYEYKRHGTLSLSAGMNCSPERSMPCQRPPPQPGVHTNSSKLLVAAYPPAPRNQVGLDNHSAHISRENPSRGLPLNRQAASIHLHAQARLLAQPHRGLLSKFARPRVLRHNPSGIKARTQERIIAGIDDVNRHPVIHTWSTSSPRLPDMIQTMETLT